jgi:hypothetical protein
MLGGILSVVLALATAVLLLVCGRARRAVEPSTG